MIRGVYIGKSNTGDYGLVSTGDYINPISPVFRLKDSGTTLEKIMPLYLIVNDISIEFAKVIVSGQMTTIRVFLSWDKENWAKEIITPEPINAIGTRIIKPFYIKFAVDDILQFYNLRQSTTITNFKLKLLYA
jgi:hypothetical protein